MRCILVRVMCFLLISLSVLMSVSCRSHYPDFELLGERESIERIDLLRREGKNDIGVDSFLEIYTLPPEEWDSFLNKLCGLEYDIPFGDGIATEYGSIAIRILYNNGDCEFIGMTNNTYFEANDAIQRSHYFNSDGFRNLFSMYVDKSLLPEWD